MKTHLIVSSLVLVFASLASAQSGIKSKSVLIEAWDKPLTRSMNATTTRKTTAPAVIVENYQRVAKASATRSGSDHTRGIEVVAVSSQQVSVEVTVDQSSAQSFDNILFKIDTAEFYDDNSRRQVDEIAAAMKAVSGATFLVEGHTCDLGDDNHNKTLSEQRASAIVTELKARGVSAERLLPLGFGETTPLPASPNTSESNRQKNRRVTIYKRA